MINQTFGLTRQENIINSLDPADLMHMAIHASANGRPDDGVRALRELLEQEPGNAEAHFLLAADYAEIALLDKAVSHYKQALNLKPDLDLARMQFGLLLTAMDKLDEASEVIGPFLQSEPATYFTDFARGLACLFREDLPGARNHFVAGIDRNSESMELNTDMRNLVINIDETTGGSGNLTEQPTDHLLSAYNKRH